MNSALLQKNCTLSVLLSILVLTLAACQSAPPPVKSSINTNKIIYKTVPSTRMTAHSNATSVPSYRQSTYAVPVIKSRDGIQDIRWTISRINGQSAQFFVNQPHLILQSTRQFVAGNTGCNAITGSYQLNGTQLKIKAIAEHQTCDHALAQEAELMDALSRVQSLNQQGNMLNLLDVNQQIVVQLQQP